MDDVFTQLFENLLFALQDWRGIKEEEISEINKSMIKYLSK